MAVAAAEQLAAMGGGDSADMEKAMAAAAEAAEGSPGDVLAGSRRKRKWAVLGKGLGYWCLMAASSAALVLGLSSATLLGRLYFVHGGSRRWLYTWIECTGWPILLIPLAISYYISWRRGPGSCCGGGGEPAAPSTKPSLLPSSRYLITPKLFLCFLALGSLTALDNLLYSWGLSYLPVSTNSLLCSSQLAFNAIFSYLLVGHRISSQTLNSVVIITLATVLLAVSSASDKPANTTEQQYVVGFVVTILASAIFALILPLMELLYKRVVGKSSFVVVMEVQVGVSMVASACSLVGMWAGGDFRALREEASAFDIGVAAYVATLVFSAIGWQLYVLGGVGIVYLASSLMSCVFMTAMIPILPLLALAFFRDAFSAVKAIAMLLSVWGFVSYLYGGYLQGKRAKKVSSLPQ